MSVTALGVLALCITPDLLLAEHLCIYIVIKTVDEKKHCLIFLNGTSNTCLIPGIPRLGTQAVKR